MNNNPCQQLEDLLPAYVMGATTDEEVILIQKLMQECPDVTADLEAYAHIGLGMMEQVTPVIPPANLRSKILEQAMEADVSPDPTLPPSVIPMRGWWVAAVLAIILIGTNLLWITQTSNLSNERDALLVQNDEIKDLLTNLQLQHIALLATSEDNNTQLANLLWNSITNEATLVTDQLPQLDTSKAYQVWLIDNDVPVSAGVFHVDTQNRSLLSITLDIELSQFGAIAISVEPASGSEAPTTDPIAVGAIEL